MMLIPISKRLDGFAVFANMCVPYSHYYELPRHFHVQTIAYDAYYLLGVVELTLTIVGLHTMQP